LVEKRKRFRTANILGRRFEEVLDIYDAFGSAAAPDRFLHVIFWLGKLAIEEIVEDNKRTITFSPILRTFGTPYSRRNLGYQYQGSFKENQL
jgi:hypothetical protein